MTAPFSRHAAIDVKWADGTHTFRLGLGEIEELERKRDLGLFKITQRLSPMAFECRISDISEVLRLGLIGGGMTPVDALVKVEAYVDSRPIDENRNIAYLVCLAGLERLHSAEAERAAGETEAKPGDGSTSPKSPRRRR